MARPKGKSVADSIGNGRYIITVRVGRSAVDRLMREVRRVADAYGIELEPDQSRADIVEAMVQSLADMRLMGLGVKQLEKTMCLSERGKLAYCVAERLRRRKRERRLWAVK